MNCPECGAEIEKFPCQFCEMRSTQKAAYQNFLRELSVVKGAPKTTQERESLARALACIRGRLANRGTLEYNPDDLLHTSRWWYIPDLWIGSAGFVVNVDDGYVNRLGSALSLHQCLWGHESGVFNDLVDFTFARETDLSLVARLLSKFKHTNPSRSGIRPAEPMWYFGPTKAAAIANQFPTFTRHFAWFAIPELMEAHATKGLRFSCSLSAENDQ